MFSTNLHLGVSASDEGKIVDLKHKEGMYKLNLFRIQDVKLKISVNAE